MKVFLLVVVLLCFGISARAQKWSSPGDPYGPLEQTDLVALQKFAMKSDIDLNAVMEKCYAREQTPREEALGRFFRFSLNFRSFDQNARTYGQLLFNSFLNLGEAWGGPAYAAVLDLQPAQVQQRVRDFLFYPMSVSPAQERDGARGDLTQEYPTLFPPQFRFANGDALFVARDLPEIYSLTLRQEPASKDLLVELVNVSPHEQKYVDSLTGPVPQFAFECQFGIRAADGEVKNISDPITLNLREEHNPDPAMPLSKLPPRGRRTQRIVRKVVEERVRSALDRTLRSSGYDSVRFVLSVALDADYVHRKRGKSAFFDLSTYEQPK